MSMKMPRTSLMALWESDLLRAAANTDPDSLARKTFYKRLRILSFMRATWDAMLISYQAVREHNRRRGITYMLDSRHVRMLNRFRSLLINEPTKAAAFAKVVFSEARAWFFGGPFPRHCLARFQTRREALIFSYGKRALPPPAYDPGLLDELKARLQSTPRPEVEDWRDFVSAYLRRFAPPNPPVLWTQPTGHASLGYTRQTGGMVKAVADLVSIGYVILRRSGELRLPFGPYRAVGPSPHPHYDELALKWYTQEQYLVVDGPNPLEAINRLAKIQERHQGALWAAVEFTLDSLEFIPVLPLYAEERGLKVRYPTVTVVAANLVYQVLRRAIDSYLIRDPRISASMGGTRDVDLSRERGPWYSADMSKATDNHPFWLTRQAYEEVVERDSRLTRYARFFPKLFGPKKILEGTSSDYLLVQPFLPPGGSDLRGQTSYPLDGVEWQNAFLFYDRYTLWIESLNGKAAELTTQGAMMGDATSFPIMPLVSVYSATKAGITTGKFCGDDALVPGVTSSVRRIFDHAARSLGANPSDHAGFLHPDAGLFCELPFWKGRVLRFQPTSIWVAPPGGSKSSANWFNQNQAAHDFYSQQGWSPRRNLQQYSPYWRYVNAAYHLGIPVGVESQLGGLLSNHYPAVSTTRHQQWLRAISSLTVAEVCAGTGLSPIPAPTSGELNKLAKNQLERLMARVADDKAARTQLISAGVSVSEAGANFPITVVRYPTSETAVLNRVAHVHTPQCSFGCSNPRVMALTERSNLTMQEFVQRTTASVATWEFYWRAPFDSADIRTPSLRMVAEKFARAVRQRSERWAHAKSSLTFKGTLRDFKLKADHFVLPNHVPRPIQPRTYGLESGELVIAKGVGRTRLAHVALEV
jgi:hypothetical protein